jgi:hypothetical protein
VRGKERAQVLGKDTESFDGLGFVVELNEQRLVHGRGVDLARLTTSALHATHVVIVIVVFTERINILVRNVFNVYNRIR